MSEPKIVWLNIGFVDTSTVGTDEFTLIIVERGGGGAILTRCLTTDELVHQSFVLFLVCLWFDVVAFDGLV